MERERERARERERQREKEREREREETFWAKEMERRSFSHLFAIDYKQKKLFATIKKCPVGTSKTCVCHSAMPSRMYVLYLIQGHLRSLESLFSFSCVNSLAFPWFHRRRRRRHPLEKPQTTV
jgi:hypothetical protein